MPLSLKRDAGICREKLTPKLTPRLRPRPFIAQVGVSADPNEGDAHAADE
jgi:hypothetical protein